MAYEIVVEQTGNGFSAFIPDLPGCVAAAETRKETIALMLEAVQLHVEALAYTQNLAFGFVGSAWPFTGITSAVVALEQRQFTLTTHEESAVYFLPSNERVSA